MKLIMILKQTLTSKLQGTHWVPYAPINCVSKINGHLLWMIKILLNPILRLQIKHEILLNMKEGVLN